MTETDETQAQAQPAAPAAPAAVAEPPAAPAEPAAPTEPEHAPAETAQSDKLNKFSEYVHVGAGAAECEHGTDGSCEDPGHVHLWCRLPNQFERQDLQTHGAAAAARKRKALRDPESNARVILDGELEGILHRGDRDVLVAEVVGLHFLEDYMSATREVAEEHDEFEHIDADKERLRVLEGMPEAERPEDEFTTLRKTISDHTQLVNEHLAAIEQPRKDSLADRSIEDLVEIVRDQRIDGLANTAHSEDYAKWMWYTCTFTPKPPSKPGFPSERYFPDITIFLQAPSEVLEAIADTVTRLEREGQVNLKGS
jgi:hypothetical protein